MRSFFYLNDNQLKLCLKNPNFIFEKSNYGVFENLSLRDFRVCSDKFVSASASTFPGYASRTRLWPLWPSDDGRRRSKQVSRNQKGQHHHHDRTERFLRTFPI